MDSPFITHRDKVLGHYGAAAYLRRLVLAMYNGGDYQTGLSFLTGLDDNHAEAAFEMMLAYRKNGENGQAGRDMVALARECVERLEQEQAARERAANFEGWLRDADLCTRTLGMRAGLADDHYNWFEQRFDDGVGADEAARQAKAAELD